MAVWRVMTRNSSSSHIVNMVDVLTSTVKKKNLKFSFYPINNFVFS